jgi:hypothetical protein
LKPFDLTPPGIASLFGWPTFGTASPALEEG